MRKGRIRFHTDGYMCSQQMIRAEVPEDVAVSMHFTYSSERTVLSTMAAPSRLTTAGVRRWGPGERQGSWTLSTELLGVSLTFKVNAGHSQEKQFLPLCRGRRMTQ